MRLQNPTEYGGQGLPKLVATAVEEMWHIVQHGVRALPVAHQGAIEAIELLGTDEQKQRYLPKMVAGSWTGTMNLTEPQAGSDLAAVRPRRCREGDHYRISGQKIFITYGEHDYTDNIIHLVLAERRMRPKG